MNNELQEVIENTPAINSIIEKLVDAIFPEKIILFGSYAYGTVGPNSDIDLLVVTDSKEFPKNYKEKTDTYLTVSRVIRDIRRQVPIDLIVHTKSMHRKFIELGSMFSKEILQRGVVLYEADHERAVCFCQRCVPCHSAAHRRLILKATI